MLFNTKFEFYKPLRRDYVIYDKSNSFILRKYLKNSSILHTRNEKLNLYVFFLNFLKGKFSKRNYIETFIELINPKIVFTTIDNNPDFYLLKKKKIEKKY